MPRHALLGLKDQNWYAVSKFSHVLKIHRHTKIGLQRCTAL